MSRHTRPVSSVIATTFLAAAVTVLTGWPSQVNADGKSKAASRQQSELALATGAPQNADLAKNEAKVGDLVVSGELVASESTPGGRVVHLECRNPTAERISGTIEVELTRTRGAVMERVMPRPQIAWRHPESVTVEPGQTLTRDVPLPRNIGGEVARIDKLRERASDSGSIPLPSTYYGVNAWPIGAVSARAKLRSPQRSKSRVAIAPDFDGLGF